MAGPKAAGTAGGSPQHTPKQFDAAASGYTLDLTPAQLEGLAKLREPFPPEAIAKRPQIKCGGCKEARTKVCSTHTKAECRECGQYVTTSHIHIDYVGHAEATDRLLEVDPTWDWEPMAKDDKGRPLIDDNGGMWITLTVCGMTRKGYGDAVGKPANTTATKEIIGDAIRNAGMRFGMALDLWAKTNLHAEPPHPAEPFMDAIRQERVWMSSEWLTGVRRDADEAGQLDFVLPRGGGKTLGDIIDAQLAVLADAAERYAEMRMKRDEERAAREEQRKAATSQVAAEHGVPPQGAPQADRQDRREQAPPPPEPPAPDASLSAQDIRASWRGEAWNDPASLETLYAAARSNRLGNEPANLDNPRGIRIGQFLQDRIRELRQAQSNRAGTARASEAAHQYGDHDDWGHEGVAG